jgi:hypothetical protein
VNGHTLLPVGNQMCTPRAKDSGLETFPDAAPEGSELKIFPDCAD